MVSIAYEGLKKEIPELENYYREFPEIFQNEMNNSLDHAARSFMKKFQNERLKGGQGVKARGGKQGLFRRFQRRADLNKMAIQVRTRSDAAIGLEEGANINSSTAMPIPLSNNKFMFDRSGKLSKKYRNLLKSNKLDYIDHKGNKFLGTKDENGQYQPLFILKHNIRLKKMLGFINTFNAHQQRIFAILEGAMEKVLIAANNPNYVLKPFKTTAKAYNANN